MVSEPDKQELSDIVEDILTLQEMRLSFFGLNGKYNPTITKLMLTKHGYKDRATLRPATSPLQPKRFV